jgi:hypothetical protein
VGCSKSWGEKEAYAYFDGQLGADEELGYRGHLKGCAHCRDLVQEVEKIRSLLDRHLEQEVPTQGPAVPPAFLTEVRRRLLPGATPFLFRHSVGGLVAAAVVVLGVTLVLRARSLPDALLSVAAADVRAGSEPIYEANLDFFRPLVRAGGGRRWFTVPSSDWNSLESALERIRTGDRLVLADRQLLNPEQLPAGWQIQADGVLPTGLRLRELQSGRTVEVVLVREAGRFQRLREIYRRALRQEVRGALDSGSSEAGSLEVFLQLPPGSTGFARVLAVSDAAFAWVFPFSSPAGWFPLQRGDTFLPPPEPLLELEEGTLVYERELKSRLGGSVCIPEANRAFFLDPQGKVQELEVSVLPFPRPLRPQSGATLVLLLSDEPRDLQPAEVALDESLRHSANRRQALQEWSAQLEENESGVRVYRWHAGAPP